MKNDRSISTVNVKEDVQMPIDLLKLAFRNEISMPPGPDKADLEIRNDTDFYKTSLTRHEDIDFDTYQTPGARKGRV